MNNNTDILKMRVHRLGLWGIISEWDALHKEPWLLTLIEHEERARSARSLERRMNLSKLGKFKPFADFDWEWPTAIDRPAIEDLLTLKFIDKAENVIIIGQNGVGKTMLAKNLAHQALVSGSSALFVTATQLLNDLAAQDSPSAINRRLRYYTQPKLLVIDELGYLASSSEHADLLFEVVTKRYECKSTIVTSNKSFNDWQDVFPNASCVVALIDRLIHSSEIIAISADSYRMKEANEQQQLRMAARAQKSKKKPR
jgi:DNA replication protein DnaC